MNFTQDHLDEIRNNVVFKQVLADSCRGVMYNVANYGKYDSREVLSLWDSLTASEQSSADGIMRGAINFMKGN